MKIEKGRIEEKKTAPRGGEAVVKVDGLERENWKRRPNCMMRGA